MDLMNFEMNRTDSEPTKVDNGCLGRGESFVAPNSTQVRGGVFKVVTMLDVWIRNRMIS